MGEIANTDDTEIRHQAAVLARRHRKTWKEMGKAAGTSGNNIRAIVTRRGKQSVFLEPLDDWLKQQGYWRQAALDLAHQRRHESLGAEIAEARREAQSHIPLTFHDRSQEAPKAEPPVVEGSCWNCGNLTVLAHRGRVASTCAHCGADLFVACPACGHGNSREARYCAACGAPLVESPAPKKQVDLEPRESVEVEF